MSEWLEPGADHVLEGGAIPDTLYVQLHTGAPGTAGTGNVAGESSRQSFTRTTPAAGVARNVGVILWESAAATETVTHVTVWTASTGGTALFGDALPSSVAVGVGENIEIAAEALSITFTLLGG